jgi:hypothetical protein
MPCSTALTQVLVGGAALAGGMAATPILDGCFAALWIGSALLFRRAGEPAQKQHAMA